MTAERAALAWRGFNVKLSAVALENVFDDGQTQTGAVLPPAVGTVNPIKALGDERKMFMINTDTLISHLEYGTAFFTRIPANRHRLALRTVAQCVDDQVGESAVNFDFDPAQIQPGGQLEFKRMGILIHSLGGRADALDQPGDIDDFIQAGIGLIGFQP